MTTTALTAASRVVEPATVRQLSVPALLTLHLVPGALLTAAFVGLAPLAETAGFPPLAALLAAIVLVLVPTELGILAWAGRSEGGGIAALIRYRAPIARRTWVWLLPALIVLAFIGFGVPQAIEPALIEQFFGWLPEWYVSPILVDRIGESSTTAWIVTLAAYFAINGIVGPIVEELYFRGYLLPRMERLGRWAPLVNVSLFSLYHLWSPWQLAARILGLGPTVYAVWWTRNVRLGIVVHCTLNTLSVILVSGLVLGRL